MDYSRVCSSIKIAALIGVGVLSGCATSGTKEFAGKPSVVITGMTQEDAQARFTSRCLSKGGRIVETNAYSITCARPMDDSMGSLFYRALATERYASNPEGHTQAAWANAGQNKLRITVNGWLEHQNAFGKTTRNYSIFNSAVKEDIQKSLNELKAEIERNNVNISSKSIDENAAAVMVPDNAKYYLPAQNLAIGYACSSRLRATNIVAYEETYTSPCGDGARITIRCVGGRCNIQE